MPQHASRNNMPRISLESPQQSSGKCSLLASYVRITPTCVRKIKPCSGGKDHPHLRGENISFQWLVAVKVGSPQHASGKQVHTACDNPESPQQSSGIFFDHQLPRFTSHVVGKHFGDSVTFDELWITPTIVGNTEEVKNRP